MARTGRPAIAYRASWDEDYVGLYKMPGARNRWRITLKGPHKGHQFTQADERLAVTEFLRLTAKNRPMVTLPVATLPIDTSLEDNNAPSTQAEEALAASMDADLTPEGNIAFIQRVEEQAIWDWCRRQILADPITAAHKLGLPQIADLPNMPAPASTITLDDIVATYTAKSESTRNTIGHVRAAIKRLKLGTGANALQDLTTAKLMAFREATCKTLAPSGAAALFGKIKSALAFAAKKGADSPQVIAALSRMKVLSAPRSTSKSEPKPITPADFRKILAVSNPQWRATLLLGLNMAMYIEDLCTLKWADFDLEAGTFVGRRAKTQVIRVGVLWPETLEAIKALTKQGKSPWVFTSTHGTRFNGQRRYNDYKELRERAGVDSPFSALRDAAYTIACRSCEDRISRVFAGHRMTGLMDSYIARNPEWVKPASDAVRAAFTPFPAAA